LLKRTMPGRKALDFQKSYRLLAKFAAKTTPGQLQQTALLLGRQPRSHADYAREMATEWVGTALPALP
jgi:hypothetical protein